MHLSHARLSYNCPSPASSRESLPFACSISHTDCFIMSCKKITQNVPRMKKTDLTDIALEVQDFILFENPAGETRTASRRQLSSPCTWDFVDKCPRFYCKDPACPSAYKLRRSPKCKLQLEPDRAREYSLNAYNSLAPERIGWPKQLASLRNRHSQFQRTLASISNSLQH